MHHPGHADRNRHVRAWPLPPAGEERSRRRRRSGEGGSAAIGAEPPEATLPLAPSRQQEGEEEAPSHGYAPHESPRSFAHR